MLTTIFWANLFVGHINSTTICFQDMLSRPLAQDEYKTYEAQHSKTWFEVHYQLKWVLHSVPEKFPYVVQVNWTNIYHKYQDSGHRTKRPYWYFHPNFEIKCDDLYLSDLWFHGLKLNSQLYCQWFAWNLDTGKLELSCLRQTGVVQILKSKISVWSRKTTSHASREFRWSTVIELQDF